MESSAKTIWLINEDDTDERLRRCYGFIKAERGWQNKFDELEAEALAMRTDPLADGQRAQFEQHRERFAKRQIQITDLPANARKGPPGPLDLVGRLRTGWTSICHRSPTPNSTR